MSTIIIKYNAGNIQSVLFALERIGVTAIVSDHPKTIEQADKIIFPGVGEASSAMAYLKRKQLDQVIRNLKQPVLGICLGMQLLCAYSEEGDTKGLRIFEDSYLKKFTGAKNLKVPQIGWNNISFQNNELFQNMETDPFVYHVHSYYLPESKYTIATAEYGVPFCTAIQKNNFYGVQFHPEKSGIAGEQILKNFINLSTCK